MGNREDVLTFRRHVYSWLQRRGPGAGHPLELFSTYGALGGFEEAVSAPEPKYRKSLTRRGEFDLVGESVSPPDAATTSFSEKMPRATSALLEKLFKSGLRFGVQAVISQAADPQDVTQWESKMVYEGVKLTSFSGDEAEADEDDSWTIEAEAQYQGRGRVFPIYFGEVAASTVTVELLDVAVYPEDDRDDFDKKEIYLLTKIVGTTAPHLIYSKTGGASWTDVALTSIGNNAPNKLRLVGDYLIISCAVSLNYYWSRRSAPATWAAVTAGFLATKGPNGLFAPAVGTIYFAGNLGYVYRTSVPGSAVTVLSAGDATIQNLTAIHGAGDCLVAVGASNAVIVSYNAGKTWSLVTGPAAGIALNDVVVWDKNTWFVCADKLYFTEDSGVTWVESPLNVTGMTVVNSVRFCKELRSVGFCVGKTATAGWMMRTEDGGASWENYSLKSVPATAQNWNAVAVGGLNYAVAVGLGLTTDGIAAIGSGN